MRAHCILCTHIVTAGPVDISGIDAIDAIRLFIFAVLFFGGVGLLMKGFV